MRTYNQKDNQHWMTQTIILKAIKIYSVKFT